MHTDPELLGLLALGEQVGTDHDRAHARTCPTCAGELAGLERVVALGRSVSADLAIATPSPGLWARIREELALDLALHPRDQQAGEVRPSGDRSVDAPGIAHASSVATEDRLAAHALLSPVTATWSHASGSAELGTDDRGRRLLEVVLHADLPTSGVRQAWLVHRDDPGLRQTLGILDGPHGLWTVEHSIDLQQYVILDISQQDVGQSQHSGQTIVRGELVLVS